MKTEDLFAASGIALRLKSVWDEADEADDDEFDEADFDGET